MSLRSLIRRSLALAGLLLAHGARADEAALAPSAEPVAIGKLLSHESDGVRVRLVAEGGVLTVTPRLEGVVKVDFVPAGVEPRSRESWCVTRTDWPAAACEVADGDPLAIRGPGWSIDVERDPVRLIFRDAAGSVRLAELADLPLQSAGAARRLAFELPAGEAVYGMGQHAQEPASLKLDHRGHALRVDNHHGPTAVQVYPWWLSARGHGVFVDNPGMASIDVGAARPDAVIYHSQAGELAYYVFLAESMAGALDKFTQVTGRPALAPRWTLGNLQSRFGYRSFADFRAIVQGFRDRGIPLDGMVMDLDWFGCSTMGNLEFQRTAEWENPAATLAAFRREGIKMIPITEPQVTALSFNAPEVLDLGLVARRPGSEMAYATEVSWITKKAPVFILDFTRPETRTWWAAKHRRLIADYGFDGFWQDLNEPEGSKPDMVFAGGTAEEVRNVLALQMNRALADAMEEHRPGARPFIMSRSGFVGMQKHGASVWSGDVGSTWFDLSRQPSLGLSMSLSAVPYWNSDIGGYGGDGCTPELYLRWCQFGFFNPVYRPHAAFKEREPWAFGPDVEAAVRELLLLRMRLVPYFYTVAREAYDTGVPMMRPLVLHWPSDPRVRDMDDQFLYGPSLMAAPVLQQGAVERTIYLPAGTWYDWFTGERHSGGASIVRPTPLSQFPLCVRAPAIVPMGPEAMRTDERPLDDVTLRVYLPPDAPRAEGSLYEDDGLTLAYADGAFARTVFVAERVAPGRVSLAISAAKGRFGGMVAEREWTAEFHDVPRPRTVRIGGAEAAWTHDDAARVLRVAVGTRPTSAAVVVEIEE